MPTRPRNDAGLSSNMEHRFSDNYDENTLPVADKGSFVIPIPKEELNVFECLGMAGEIMPHPSVPESPSGSNAEMLSVMGPTKPESHRVAAVAQNFPAQVTPIALSEKGMEEEAVDALPGTTTTTAGEPELESCSMDPGGNPVKPNCRPLVRKDARSGNRPRKRAARNNRKFFPVSIVLALVFIPASGGFPGVQPADQKLHCFTCMDKDKCPMLKNIYDHNDTQLYHRDDDEAFPKCTAISSPASKTCTVCLVQANITTIICSMDVGKFDVEADDGSLIETISHVCEHQLQPRGCAHTGLIPNCSLYLIVAAGLVLLRCF
ncbi:uncharacterized protein [Trachinotus anak]|uniref:uncharacterized protein isoform X2 n=1 Tax=Trachinotus anak TaxID=443729 RepID=UPI0039F16E75